MGRLLKSFIFLILCDCLILRYGASPIQYSSEDVIIHIMPEGDNSDLFEATTQSCFELKGKWVIEFEIMQVLKKMVFITLTRYLNTDVFTSDVNNLGDGTPTTMLTNLFQYCSCTPYMTVFTIENYELAESLHLTAGDLTGEICFVQLTVTSITKHVTSEKSTATYDVTSAFFFNAGDYTMTSVHNLLTITNTDIFALNEMFYASYVSFVAWFKIELSNAMLVKQLVVMSGDVSTFKSVTDLFLSYRLDQNVVFQVYEEKGQRKFFTGDFTENVPIVFDLENPFIASELVISVHGGQENMYFKFDIRKNEAVQVFQEKPYITCEENTKINFEEEMLITALVFYNYKYLPDFKITYKINADEYYYKENPISTSSTIVSLDSNEIKLRPFRASSLEIIPLSTLPSYPVVCVKGESALNADYMWRENHHGNFTNEDDFIVKYSNTKGKGLLYGHSNYLTKVAPGQKLMTNHFGHDCLTKPDLCDHGLTVQLRVNGSLLNDSQVVYKKADGVFSYSSTNAFDYFDDTVLGSYSTEKLVTYLYFQNLYIKGIVKIMDCKLTLAKINYKNNENFDVNIHAFVSHSTTFHSDVISHSAFIDESMLQRAPSTMKKNIGTEFTKPEIQLTDLLNKVLAKHDGNFDHLLIVILPVSITNRVVKFENSDHSIFIKYKTVLVPGVIQSIPFQTKIENNYHYIDFDSRYALSAVKIWKQERVDNTVDVTISAVGMEFMGEKIKDIFKDENLEYEKLFALSSPLLLRSLKIYINPYPNHFTIDFYGTKASKGNETYGKDGDQCDVGDNLNSFSCEIAGKMLWGLDVTIHSHQYKPTACYKEGGKLYFNTFPAGTTSASIKSLCWKYQNSDYGDDYDVYPIITSGLHGPKTNLTGTGFSIQYSESDLEAFVQTETEVFAISYERSNIPTEDFYLTMAWSKDKLELFIDGDLVESASGDSSIANVSSIPDNEYLLLFGSYYNLFTDSHLSLKEISLWRTPLSEQQVKESTEMKTDAYKCLETTVPEGFECGSRCYCINQICPCEVIGATFMTSYASESAEIFEMVNEIYSIFDGNVPITIYDGESSLVHFDNVSLNFDDVRITEVYLTGEIVELIDICSVVIYAWIDSEDVKRSTLECGTIVNGLYKSPDLLFLFVPLLKLSTKEQPMIITVQLEKVHIVSCSLEIKYQPPKPGSFFFTSAVKMTDDDLSSVFTLESAVGDCLKFECKFEGNGFVDLTVYEDGVEFGRFYPLEADGQWIQVEYSLSVKANDKYRKIEIVALRNGLNIGYLAFKHFDFHESQCQLPRNSAEPTVNAVIDTLRRLRLPVPLLFVTDSGALFSQNEIESGDVVELNTVFPLTNQKPGVIKQLTVYYIGEFTLLLWFDGTLESDIIKVNAGSESLIVVCSSGQLLRVSYQAVYEESYISAEWHFLAITYNPSFSKVNIKVDMQDAVTLEDVHFPDVDFMEIKFWDTAVSFQLYNFSLSPAHMVSAQVDPSKVSLRSCVESNDLCKFCNALYHTWELTPRHEIFFKNSSCIRDLNVEEMIAYETFDSLSTKNMSVIEEFSFGFLTKGIYVDSPVNVMSLSECDLNCSVSLWSKFQCLNGKRRELFNIFSVTFLCTKNETNPVVIQYNGCSQRLVATTGVWANIALTFDSNGTLLLYWNGLLAVLERCDDDTIEVDFEGKGLDVNDEVWLDEIILTSTNNVREIFLRQLAGSFKLERAAQMLPYMVLKIWFLLYDWNEHLLNPGYFLWNETAENLTGKVFSNLKHIPAVRYISVTTFHKCEQNDKTCAVIKCFVTEMSPNVLHAIVAESNVEIKFYGYEDLFSFVDGLLVIYAKSTVLNVISDDASSFSFNINIPEEDPRYRVAGCNVIIVNNKNNSEKFTHAVSNMDYVQIKGLRHFSTYYICIEVYTLLRRFSQSVCLDRMIQTAESVPSEAPYFNCKTMNDAERIKCNLSSISDEHWHGHKCNYTLAYRILEEEENCTVPEYNGTNSLISIAFKDFELLSKAQQLVDSGDNMFTISTNDVIFKKYCIFSYASTMNCTGVGAISILETRSPPGAPSNHPANIQINIGENGTEITFAPLEERFDIWNSYQGRKYRICINEIKSSNISEDCENTLVTHEAKSFLNLTGPFLKAVRVSAISVKEGEQSPSLCKFGLLTKPSVNAKISKFSAMGSRQAVFNTDCYLTSNWRGRNTYWQFNIISIDAKQVLDECLTVNFALDHNLHEYENATKLCNWALVRDYLEQDTKQSVPLCGLQPNRQYNVSIQACNEYGCSDETRAVGIRTYTDIPTCPPENLAVQNISSTSIRLTWNSVDNSCENGPILGYNVKCNRSESEIVIDTIVENSLNLTLKGLEHYERLCCKVAGMTVNGTGPFTKKCAYTEQNDPDAVVEILNCTSSQASLNLSVIQPSFRMNGIVRKIKVTRMKYLYVGNPTETIDDEAKILLFDISSTTLYNGEVVLSFFNLTAGVLYKFSFQYLNDKGIGPVSNFTCATSDSLPGAPSWVSNSTDNVREINITWGEIAADEMNGDITKYEVCHQQKFVNGSVKEEVCYTKKNTHIRSFLLHSLDRGSIHYVSVAGCNKAGCGERRVILGAAKSFVDGMLSEWNRWSECDVTCGKGKKYRTRECSRHSEGGFPCSQHLNETANCEGPPCLAFVTGEKGDGNCSSICQPYHLHCSAIFLQKYIDHTIFKHSTSQHDCDTSALNDVIWKEDHQPNYNEDNNQCHGYENLPERFVCEPSTMPENLRRICNCVAQVDLGYLPWAEWSMCYPFCGEIVIMKRKRKCVIDHLCNGVDKEEKTCHEVGLCPIDGDWNSWSNFDHCNSSCGIGFKKRTRTCTNPHPQYGGDDCQGLHIDVLHCNLFPCPKHGNFSEWSSWSICDQPCGHGISTRKRLCNNPKPDLKGNDCIGESVQSRPCNSTNMCRPVLVSVKMKCKNREYNWPLYSQSSRESQVMAANVSHEIRHTLKNTSGVEGFVIDKFSKGSLIVDFTISYLYHTYQSVELYDSMLTTHHMNDLLLSSVSMNSQDVCLPPTNISVEPLDETSVTLTWILPNCNTTIWTYVYYKDLDVETSNWQVTGMPLDVSSFVLSFLVTSHMYKAYMVAASGFANGLPSSVFSMQTVGSPPSAPPPTVSTVSPKSTRIYVEWTDIPVNHHNGRLSGYRIKYRKYLVNEPFSFQETQFGFNAFTIKKLKPYTLYLVMVMGFNEAGEGPVQYSMCKTIEDVPSIPTPNFSIRELQDLHWWSVSWGEIPAEFTNGVLLGYRLTYYIAQRSGLQIEGEKQKIEHDFDIYTRYHKQKFLLSYTTCNVSVAGFTAAGSGPAPEYEINTCRCPEMLFANWYVKHPLVSLASDFPNPSGFFKHLIHEAIITSCQHCKNYPSSRIYYTKSLTGDNPQKTDEFELKNSINELVDLSFPVYDEVRASGAAGGSSFGLILKSPGIALIVRNENNVSELVEKMILNVFNVWPILLISYLIATLFGICIWFTDQFINPDEFSIGSSLTGPLIGFWFAFVTMTTVGYGDQTPRSVIARVFAMTWFLVGLVLNGIIIGFITTSVTSFGLVEEVSIYNTKTAALSNTFEYRKAVLRSADMENLDQYTDIDSMLVALQSKKVDIVYVDVLLLLGYQSTLDSMSLKITLIEDMNTGFGYLLSGNARVIGPDVHSFIETKAGVISSFAASLEDRIPKLVVEKAGESTQDVFSADSPAFASALRWLCMFIGAGFVFGLLFEMKRICCKNKVHREESYGEELVKFGNTVDDFLEQFTNNCEEMTSLHNKQRLELMDLKASYKKKVFFSGFHDAEDLVRRRYALK